ncbi:hypothetical protein BD769DRAFT_1388691 [Suillus cothurnatus]|nr:hypothetical protein BD769DRAFT_1388691 [Suillus cothurnatus]
MTDAITELVELFDAEGAFIFAFRQGRPCPAFEVVTAKDIRDFRCPYQTHHYNGVLFAMNDLYGNNAQLTRTIRTIANDGNIKAVYAESVELARHLAIKATILREDMLVNENGIGIDQTN